MTLLDLSVTLLIIGLITSMMVKGEELISQARIKAIVADFSGARVAVDAYRDRYGRLPGDDDGVGRWSSTGVVPVGGNGDSVLNGPYNAVPTNPPAPTEESNLFWWHLRLSGILSGPIDAFLGPRQPLNFAGGIIGVQAQGATLGLPGLVVCSSNLVPRVASGVDLTSDDGLGQSGDVRAMRSTMANPPIPVATAAQAIDELGSEPYVLCRSLSR